MAQAGAIAADSEIVTKPQPSALTGVSERIDALEGHLSQLLARQRGSEPPSSGPQTPARSGGQEPGADPDDDGSGRIVRAALQFDGNDDPEGFDERFTAFTDATEVDERSRDWLLS